MSRKNNQIFNNMKLEELNNVKPLSQNEASQIIGGETTCTISETKGWVRSDGVAYKYDVKQVITYDDGRTATGTWGTNDYNFYNQYKGLVFKC